MPEVLLAARLTWGLRGAGLQVAGLFAHRLHQRVAAPDDVLPLVALHIPHPHSDAAGFRALGKREGEVRQDPAVAGVCAKPGSAQKKLCSMEMSGKGGKLFPLAECHVSAPHRWPLAPSLLPAPSAARSSLRPGIRGCAPIPCRCDPPSSSHCPSQRAANELAQSVRCSVAPGWLQPPRGCGTPPPPAPQAWGCGVSVSARRATDLQSRSWARCSVPAALWMPRQAGITAGLLWLIIGCNDGLQD